VNRRVKQLHYDVIYLSGTCQIAESAEPLQVLLNGFDCTLTHDKLRAQPRDDYEDAADAISALQPALDAWSAMTELVDRCPLAFELAGFHDEPVPPPDGQVIYPESIVSIDTATAEEKFVVTRDRFPAPRDDIQTEGPVAAQLRRRWRNVELGIESRVAVGYYVFTSIKRRFGDERKAAKELEISANILTTLRRVCSIADPLHGRKADGSPGTITSEGRVRSIEPTR
jgi:hypothetical protein